MDAAIAVAGPFGSQRQGAVVGAAFGTGYIIFGLSEIELAEYFVESGRNPPSYVR